jgi:hypothetical protein
MEIAAVKPKVIMCNGSHKTKSEYLITYIMLLSFLSKC